MTIFNHQRLPAETFKLDIERMRQGWYSDKYFANINHMLTTLSQEGYTYAGKDHNLPAGIPTDDIHTSDIEVEMQWFTRRPGTTIVVGVDKALAMLRTCSGYWDGEAFVSTADRLEVEAIHDGDLVLYSGNPTRVQPVIRVRGRYRDFALLETPTLGILTRASRVATNVYQTLVAARGKPVLFFPARFDLHEVQAADGYAYDVAIDRFNLDYAQKLGPFISTDAQGDWWGGAGGGTVAHAAIACFLGDTAEIMRCFAATLPPDVPRIALVDFNNDNVRDALAVCDVMFEQYRRLVDAGETSESEKFKLFGIRLDTSSSLRDVSVQPIGEARLDLGVNPRLVFTVRQALDSAWERWDLPQSWKDRAREYCCAIKIVVSGGFNVEKISRFERLDVPVDFYAVGSSLFDNHGPTVTDFTADVVQIKVHGQWVDMAKVGRTRGENPALERVW
jgi:nicotinate phosphoribosyltransferase